MRTVFQDQLLQEMECSLVKNFLPDLNAGSPVVGGETLLTVGTLLKCHDIYNLEALLQQHALLNGILDRQLDLDSSRVRLSPDEARIDDSHFVQASQLLEAESQKLARFGHGDDPTCWWQHPSLAVSALLDGGFSLDSIGDVVGQLDTVVASCARGRRSIDRSTAVVTEDSAEKNIVSQSPSSFTDTAGMQS